MKRTSSTSSLGKLCHNALIAAISGVVLAMGVTRSHAIISTWDGGGANDNIAAANNWTTNVAPTSDINNTDLIFFGGVRPTPNFSAVFATNSIGFGVGTVPFTVGGSQINVGLTGISNGSTSIQTFSNLINFSLVSTSTINASSGALTFTNTITLPTTTLTVDGASNTSFANFSGNGAITKQGTGTMNWSPSTSHTCDVNLNAGTLTLAADGTTDTFSSTSAIAVNGTSTLNVNESFILDGGALTRASGATLNVSAGKSFTIQNGGSVSITGSFAPATSSSIAVTGAGSSLNTSTSLSINGGGLLSVSSGGSVNYGLTTLSIGTASGSGIVNVGGTGTSVTGTGSVLVGQNAFNGAFNVSGGASASIGGSLSIANAGVTGTVGTSVIQTAGTVTASSLTMATIGTFNANATLTINGAGSSVTLNGSSNSIVGSSSTSVANINIQSSGTLNTSAASIFTLNPTGTIAITGGSLNANGNMTLEGQLTRDATGVFTIASGKTLTVQNGGDVNITGLFNNSNAATINVTGTGSTFNSVGQIQITGGSALNVTAGADVLAGGNNLSIANTIGNGTVTVDGAGSTLGAGSQLQISNSGTAIGVVTYSNGASGSFGSSIVVGSSNTGPSNGTLNIQLGSVVTGANLLSIASGTSSATGTVTVTGTGSQLTISGIGDTVVGNSTSSVANFNITNSGTYTSGTGDITIAKTGVVNITAGGTFNANGDMFVQGQVTRDATSTLSMASGKTLTVQSGGDFINTGPYAVSPSTTVNIDGTGSTVTAAGIVGINGGSTVNLTNAGSLSTSGMYIDVGNTTNGTLNVTNPGSTISGVNFYVGFSGGIGTATFSNGATGTYTSQIHVSDTAVAGTQGTLNIQSGSSLTGFSLSLATLAATNTGTITISGGSSLILSGATSTIGATSLSTATINISDISTFSTTGTLLNPTGTINITDSTVNLGNLTDNGGTINFNSGSLSYGGNLQVGSGGLLGTNLTLNSNRVLSLTGTTTIDTFRTLTLDGGTLNTGTIVNNGTFNFVQGTLGITGVGGLTVGTGGALGSTLIVSTGKKINVTGTSIVSSSGVLVIGDGQFNPIAGISNNGEIRLDGIAPRLAGGTIFNSKLIRGDGQIDSVVSNSTGEIRVENAKTLRFTNTVTQTGGKINLQGGTVQFSLALSQSAASLITGHGTFIADAGLTNNGQIQLSGGNSDFFGTITSTNGSKITVAGANNATFFNNVTMQTGSQFNIGSGSFATFFGNVTGTNNFAGTGTAEFWGGSSALKLVNYPGTAIVEENASLTADAMRVNSLQVNGNTSINSNGTSVGVSEVKSLAISSTGILNLHNNDIIINYGTGPSAYNAIVQNVKDGLTVLGGSGATGIASTEVDAQTLPGTILAVVDDGDPIIGGAITTTSGYTLTNPTRSVIVKYTWFGDANLDGAVDGADYALLDTGFTSGGTLGGWVFGDFDYNGIVEGPDYALIDTGFVQQNAILPEPGMLGLLGLAALMMRRNRKSISALV